MLAPRYATVAGQTIDIEASLIALDRAECADSLSEFIRQAWHVVEPGQPYVHGWHIDAMCEHLEALTLDDSGSYNRLLINIPPGAMKSLTVAVFWPAWEWGPQEMPHMRYLCASHSLETIGIRDSMKMRRLVSSEWYQKRWPHVKLTRDQNAKTKFENTATGFRQTIAAGGITGSRGDRVIIDDPHSVESASSDAMRASTLEWFTEAVPTRLNNPMSSAIVVIMQRLHEEDVSGVILDRELGYDHLCLPMRATMWRREHPTALGFIDPRTIEGELLFPERFPEEVVTRDEKVMGKYAVAGQFQQEPAPRGGGIIQREWWKPYDLKTFPAMDYIVASLDTAYTEKTENDFSALTVWGVFSGAQAFQTTRYALPGGRLVDQSDAMARFNEAMMIRSRTTAEGGELPSVMLMNAWQERLALHPLVNKIAETCKALKVDMLLIENKAAGHSVAQEIRRLFGHEGWGVKLIDTGRIDKMARLVSVSHMFEEGMIYAPDKAWAEMVIQQTSIFPRGKHDDLVDTVAQAIRHLRDIGLLTRAPEWAATASEGMRHTAAPPPPLYPA